MNDAIALFYIRFYCVPNSFNMRGGLDSQSEISSTMYMPQTYIYPEFGESKKLYPDHPSETIVFPIGTYFLMKFDNVLVSLLYVTSILNTLEVLLIIPISQIFWLLLCVIKLSSTEK